MFTRLTEQELDALWDILAFAARRIGRERRDDPEDRFLGVWNEITTLSWEVASEIDNRHER